jgi:hypothetical protein
MKHHVGIADVTARRWASGIIVSSITERIPRWDARSRRRTLRKLRKLRNNKKPLCLAGAFYSPLYVL